jgi:Fe-S cluster assembly protein SufD
VLDGESTGVFQGKIIVRPHAQKTDGAMKSDTLLLSDGASMNNKPELESSPTTWSAATGDLRCAQ